VPGGGGGAAFEGRWLARTLAQLTQAGHPGSARAAQNCPGKPSL
jgi:hypothetical protein